MVIQRVWDDFKSNLFQFKAFVRVAGFKPYRLAGSAGLSFIAASCDGLSMALLPILLRGLSIGSFEFVSGIPIVRHFLKLFPAFLENRNGLVFFLLLTAAFGLMIFKNVFQYLSLLTLSRQLRSCANHLRKSLFEKSVYFNKSFFDRTNPGRLYQTAIGDTELLSYALQGMNGLILAVFSLLVYSVLLMRLSFELSLFVLAVAPPMQLITQWIIRKIRRSSDEYDSVIKRLGDKLHGTLSCIPLVKLYNREEREISEYRRVSDDVMRHQISIDKKREFLAPVNELLMLVMLMLLIAVSAFLVVKRKQGQITDYMVYFFVLKRVMTSLGTFSSFQSQLALLHGPITSILDYLKIPGERESLRGRATCPMFNKDIVVKDLNFGYDTGRRVLCGISLTIPKNKMTAIVGRTGSGKSTLIQILLRFYEPSPGQIRMDGQDITEFDIRSYRDRFAFVSQDAVVFNDSLRHNLVYGLDRVIPDAEILAAVEKSRLTDLVRSHPDGLELQVGEKGYQLSGGEKQRLAIARAMLKDADILVLDEATSAMDSETEKKIQESIDEVVRTKTSIVIAHRLSTIRKADQVVVLDKGRIIEEGAPQVLLKDGGVFQKLWELQGF